MDSTPEFREILLIGGPRHGETIRLADGSKNYTDLRSATTYSLQTFQRATTGPLGTIVGMKAHDVLVADGMLSGRNYVEVANARRQVQMLIAEIIVGRWFEREGYDVDTAPVPTQTENGHPLLEAGDVSKQ